MKRYWLTYIILGTLFLGGCEENTETDVSKFSQVRTDIINHTKGVINDFIKTPPSDNHLTVEVVEVLNAESFIVKYPSRYNTNDDVNEEVVVKLLNVDAPETDPLQHWGKTATEFVKSKIEEKTVILEMTKQTSPYDSQGRILAFVWLNDDTMLQDYLLNEGLAKMDIVAPPDDKYKERFYREENMARDQKKNIWSVKGYAGLNGYDMSVIND